MTRAIPNGTMVDLDPKLRAEMTKAAYERMQLATRETPPQGATLGDLEEWATEILDDAAGDIVEAIAATALAAAISNQAKIADQLWADAEAAVREGRA